MSSPSMRINKFIALATGLSRRTADAAVRAGRVSFNGQPAGIGQLVEEDDRVLLDGKPLTVDTRATRVTIMLNKPAGYVVSRQGQGSKTIYDLLPQEYQRLKPVGRLDKDSSGLLLLTDDGQLAFELTHPSKRKSKMYEVTLDRALTPAHRQMISDHGISLSDGLSRLELERLRDDDTAWRVTMYEGRNRQIRRTFAAVGYSVTTLFRTAFGAYQLADLATGVYRPVHIEGEHQA